MQGRPRLQKAELDVIAKRMLAVSSIERRKVAIEGTVSVTIKLNDDALRRCLDAWSLALRTAARRVLFLSARAQDVVAWEEFAKMQGAQ